MGERIATCSCGNVRVACSGEPTRISMCHCLACQRRTGAPFGVQAWFKNEHCNVTGTSSAYTRTVEVGKHVTFQFCPGCGSTVYWQLSAHPDRIAVALGMFADPDFPAPRVSVWERRRHPWTVHISDCQMEHIA
jgi:hypothetical protein